ncbi:class I adenylate-forming enzyme family protein [Xanthobacteraceae bacterium A53D]
MHLGSLFRRTRAWHAGRTAIVDDVGTWTFDAFLGRAARFGSAMDALGLARGDRVALLLPNIRESLEAGFGAMAAGFVRVTLDPDTAPDDLIARLRHAAPRVLVTDPAHADLAAQARREVPGLAHVIIARGSGAEMLEYEPLLAAACDRFPPPGIREELAALDFSPSQRGAPRAIMMKHHALTATVHNVIAGFDIGEDSVFLNLRPLWHADHIILLAYLSAGARVVLGGRFEAERFPFQMARFSITRTALEADELAAVLEHLTPDDVALNAMNALHVSAPGLSAELFEEAMEIIGPRIGRFYGPAEAPITCYLPPERLAGKKAGRAALHDSSGKPLFTCELALDGVDPDSDPDGTGRLLIRGPHMMAGYWKEEAASAAAIRSSWLHTQDGGRFSRLGDLTLMGGMPAAACPAPTPHTSSTPVSRTQGAEAPARDLYAFAEPGCAIADFGARPRMAPLDADMESADASPTAGISLRQQLLSSLSGLLTRPGSPPR